MVLLVPSITLFDDSLHQQVKPSFYTEDEELLYDVSWAGIKIGPIRLKTLSVQDSSEAIKHKAVAYIDSHSGLPFVNVHFVAYTEMDSSFNSLGSYSYEKQDKEWQRLTYRYDLLKKVVVVEEAYQETLDSLPYYSVVRDTLHLKKFLFKTGYHLFS
jgi:hypothetical protein